MLQRVQAAHPRARGDTGESLSTINVSSGGGGGDENALTCVALSATGRVACSGGVDKTVKVRGARLSSS